MRSPAVVVSVSGERGFNGSAKPKAGDSEPLPAEQEHHINRLQQTHARSACSVPASSALPRTCAGTCVSDVPHRRTRPRARPRSTSVPGTRTPPLAPRVPTAAMRATTRNAILSGALFRRSRRKRMNSGLSLDIMVRLGLVISAERATRGSGTFNRNGSSLINFPSLSA